MCEVVQPRGEDADAALTAAAQTIPENHAPQDWCQLIQHDEENELHMLAAALYSTGGQSYTDCMAYVRALEAAGRTRLAETLLGDLTRHDIPPRAVEHSSYTVDLILDQGAYFELKRHRMMTQTPQPLTTHLG